MDGMIERKDEHKEGVADAGQAGQAGEDEGQSQGEASQPGQHTHTLPELAGWLARARVRHQTSVRHTAEILSTTRAMGPRCCSPC